MFLYHYSFHMFIIIIVIMIISIIIIIIIMKQRDAHTCLSAGHDLSYIMYMSIVHDLHMYYTLLIH